VSVNQGKKLFASLVLVVDALRKPEVLEGALKGLGTRHVKYGVLPEHYPMVGGSLLKTFEAELGDEWTAEVKQAWVDAYGAVTQLMLAGADYPPESLRLSN
jgi:hemoglobin-like flavoprotein